MEAKGNAVRTNWFDRSASYLEQNIFGVKLGIYAVALGGLGIALRSVRPFAKFARPQDIPQHFYSKHMRLSGQVVGVAAGDKNPRLMVNHAPILLSKLRQERCLPIQVEAVDVTGNGFSWLQTVLKGKNVDFVLLKPCEGAVNCIVYHQKENVAQQLVALGFASVAPFDLTLDKDPIYTKYYEGLLKEETKAERKQMGMWQDGKRTMSNIFDYFLGATKKVKVNLP